LNIRLRGSVVVAGAVAAALGLGGPAVAAPTTDQVRAAQVRTAAAAPSYATWVADVTVVADQAKAYLRTRLPDASVRPAIVLDIDNTSLETHYNPGITVPANKPVLELAKQAKAAGAAVFFVTARPEVLTPISRKNLTDVGYPIDGLYARPTLNFEPKDKLKTKARIAIEERGYTIVANVGNLQTDLVGGHAERTFKLPDYDGALS
jgi:predicted secreted acid phosphatase